MLRNIFPSLLIFAVAIAGSYYFVQNRNAPDTELATLEQIVDVVDVQASEGAEVQEMALGSEDAPVTVIEYASFTCPHCARFHEEVFGALKTDYIDTGKIRFIQRDVYFDRFGLWAAMLARCEGKDKYFGMSDLIFSRQKEWTKGDSNAELVANLKKLGRIAGMDDATMDGCLQNNDWAQALVAAYQKNADADDISGTPSFIINGEKYPNMSLDDFRDTLDGLLAD